MIQMLAERGGKMQSMNPDGRGRVRLLYHMPARGLIGFATAFASATSGTGLLYHVFDHYGPRVEDAVAERINGVLISNDIGEAVAYAMWNLEDRGPMIIDPGVKVYRGMIIGIHNRDNDLTVNALKGKQLTNVRASGKDDALNLSPPIRLSLEQALEFINEDELVEITPAAIRLRKSGLTETDRKRAARA